MSKTTVIYHSADFDGLFCREIAKKFIPDAELIGWDFKDEPIQVPSEGTIYVMDLPIDRVFGFDFSTAGYQRFCERVIWIDHHKSNIETHPPSIPGYRIDGVSACRLAWQWFTHDIAHNVMSDPAYLPKLNEYGGPIKDGKGKVIGRYPYSVTEPKSVELVGRYDVWDKIDPDVELFQHGLKSVPLTDGIWDELLEPKNFIGMVRVLLDNASIIQFTRDNEYEQVIKDQGFDLSFEGLKFLACCSHECDIRSQLFAAGVKPEHDALMGFTYTGKAWRVSLYHAPGKEHHDLSLIAKKHGGGGHAGACGFMSKTVPFPCP